MMATKWYVVCNPELNEQVALLLTEQGIAAESLQHNLRLPNGTTEYGWNIPGNMVQKIKDALRAFPHFKAQFYTQSSAGATLQKADFVFKRRKNAALTQVQEELVRLKSKNKKNT
ncbi:hypothetical protein A3C87_03540 [Candidatus Kaiserbacteria bacterium RIFCSPHIGHO2_02_FULL_49_34]|uniref:Uncharacterized protein n=1 Tax=Candidatus Kaiserbacteria bacterium RIFCSPHIGHO2_02_FULL_49_34 TaxID=1798491 RepID=A0A1F6DIG6_9BACT|nr:MAG: hypothetical protein A3C87_03540 [Candidatus Kaiserbacteria bacterium RIFCSPHIGHO2_02_FULL_49_34]